MRPENTEDNAARCLCPGCPTYDECMSGEKSALYCSRGATACNPKANGCICGECPVYVNNGLDGGYYCTEGAA